MLSFDEFQAVQNRQRASNNPGMQSKERKLKTSSSKSLSNSKALFKEKNDFDEATKV